MKNDSLNHEDVCSNHVTGIKMVLKLFNNVNVIILKLRLVNDFIDKPFGFTVIVYDIQLQHISMLF